MQPLLSSSMFFFPNGTPPQNIWGRTVFTQYGFSPWKSWKFCREMLDIQGDVCTVYHQLEGNVSDTLLERQLWKPRTAKQNAYPAKSWQGMDIRTQSPTFQGGFLEDFHCVELSRVGPLGLPHQEHLTERTHNARTWLHSKPTFLI